jgi:hypothetical protein
MYFTGQSGFGGDEPKEQQEDGPEPTEEEVEEEQGEQQ